MNAPFLPQVESATLLSSVDYFVFALVFLLSSLAALIGHRKLKGKQSEEDYLLMGRQLTLPFFVATLVATWYGGIFPVTELAFREGIFNFVAQGLFWYGTYIIFALFVVDKLKEHNPLTLPDLTLKLFGPKASQLTSYFNIADALPIAYSLSLGYFCQSVFGGELWLWTLLGTLLVAAYAFWGGFRGVVYSDVVQFACMIMGVFLVILLSVKNFGGLSFLQSQLPKTHFHMTGTQGVGQAILWGLIALGTLVNPGFHQRCYAANSKKTARRGIFFATIIWMFFDLCTTFGGMYAAAIIPSANPNSAYMTYALQLLPTGLKGFFLAAILATILSTLDSFLFISANTFSHDLKLFNKSRFSGLALAGILSVALAILFSGSILDIWKTIGSFNAAVLLTPLLVGMYFPNRISDKLFAYSALASSCSMIIWKIAQHFLTESNLTQSIDSFSILAC